MLIERGCSELPQTKEGENGKYHDDEANQVDDVVHGDVLFRWLGSHSRNRGGLKGEAAN
jgi:hypothetical protein